MLLVVAEAMQRELSCARDRVSELRMGSHFLGGVDVVADRSSRDALGERAQLDRAKVVRDRRSERTHRVAVAEPSFAVGDGRVVLG